jgi:selenocysteine lyase/cysteine desulfurase
VAFTLAGQPADQVARGLGELGVFASSGDFYAATVVQRLGVPDGLVRAGCACYTTMEEVERLIEGVRRLSSLRR